MRRLRPQQEKIMAKFTEVGSSLGIGDKIHLFMERHAAKTSELANNQAKASTKSDSAVKSADGDLWWVKDLPWWMPPPPEWGELPPTMYTAYYHLTKGATLSTPNYGSLFRRVEDLEPPVGQVAALPSNGENDGSETASTESKTMTASESPTSPVANPASASFLELSSDSFGFGGPRTLADHLVEPQVIPVAREVLYDKDHHYHHYWMKKQAEMDHQPISEFAFKSENRPLETSSLFGQSWHSSLPYNYWKSALGHRHAYFSARSEQPSQMQQARAQTFAREEMI